MSTARQTKSPPGITPNLQAKDGCLYGVPPVVTQAVMNVTTKWGNTISIRASSPIPRGLYSRTGQPKSIDTHVKSCNWGMGEGFASVDERVDRVEKNGAIRKRVKGDLPIKDGKVDLEVHPLKRKLEDILFQIYIQKPPKYTVLDSDDVIKQSGKLRVSQLSDNPIIASTIFEINLDEKINKQASPDRQNLEGTEPIVIPQPSWWKQEWGDFQERIGLDHQIYFSTQQPDGTYSAVAEYQVFGKNGAPIVRDCDLYSVSKPTQLEPPLDLSAVPDTEKLMTELNKVVDTSTPEGTAFLLSRIILLNALEQKAENKILPSFIEVTKDGKHALKADYMNVMSNYIACMNSSADKSAIRIGMCTAFEVYQMMEINCFVAGKFSKDIQMGNFIQHGSENRNIHYTQPDGPTISFCGQNIFAAASGNDTAKYIASNDKQFKGTFVANPNWASGSAYQQPAWVTVLEKQAKGTKPDHDSVTMLATFKTAEEQTHVQKNNLLQHPVNVPKLKVG